MRPRCKNRPTFGKVMNEKYCWSFLTHLLVIITNKEPIRCGMISGCSPAFWYFRQKVDHIPAYIPNSRIVVITAFRRSPAFQAQKLFIEYGTLGCESNSKVSLSKNGGFQILVYPKVFRGVSL